jgi:hypothetical protein
VYQCPNRGSAQRRPRGARSQGRPAHPPGAGRARLRRLFARGVTVTYETIRCWCAKFGEGFAHRVKAARRKPGSTWHLSRSSGICCALHCIANSLQQGSLTGANSLNSPKILRLGSKRSPHLPPFRLMLGKLTTPDRLLSEHTPIRASRLSALPLQVCGFRGRRPEFEVHENRYIEMCNHPTTGKAHALPTGNPGRGSCRISAS